MNPMRRGLTHQQFILIFLVLLATLAAGYVAQMPIDISALRDPSTLEPPTDMTTPDASPPLQENTTAGQAIRDGAEQDGAKQLLADDMIQRPLFEATRRPPSATVAASPSTPKATAPVVDVNPPPPPPSGLRFVGVLRLGNATTRALLRHESADRGVWLAIGSRIAGWRISAIDVDYVVLENGGSVERIKLNRGGQSTAR